MEKIDINDEFESLILKFLICRNFDYKFLDL